MTDSRLSSLAMLLIEASCACSLDLGNVIKQGCATGGPRATTRPAKPFSVALANTLIFPYHA